MSYKKKDKKESCGNCRFWLDLDYEQDGEFIGLCQRYPPVRIKSERDDLSIDPEAWDHPTTNADSGWCGEWEGGKI